MIFGITRNLKPENEGRHGIVVELKEKNITNECGENKQTFLCASGNESPFLRQEVHCYLIR